MTGETILEVARELIGPIQPVGDAAIDGCRLENLIKAVAVTQGLLDDICKVADCDGDHLASVRKAGKTAVQRLHEMLEET